MGISKTQVAWFILTTVTGVVFSSLALPPNTGLMKKPKKWLPSNNAIIVKFDGYRRAIDSEIPDYIKAEALASLSNALGSFTDIGNFRVAIETHWDSKRGEHKGASVFIKG